MTDQPTDHRGAADASLAAALEAFELHADDISNRDEAFLAALIGIGHALLAQDHNRCTATRGHTNGHHYPADTGVTT